MAGEPNEQDGYLQYLSVPDDSKGAFNFAQSALPLLLKNAETKPQHPPTLIFTGATASVKGSAMFSSFAPPKFAQRALAQSLAREFSPKGVHIGHVIVDGIIATPMTKNWMPDAAPDAKLSPDAVRATCHLRYV